jgi:hypothetical protein
MKTIGFLPHHTYLMDREYCKYTENYTNFMNQQETLMIDVANGIFDYYNSVRDEYREMLGDDADTYAPIISSVDELAPLVKFTHLIVENFNK